MTGLPAWLDPLYTGAEMRAVDEWAIETQGVPALDLMDRAGLGLARLTARLARPGPIRIVIGKGNNGGDGLVAARFLREEGREVDVLSVVPLDELTGDSAANLERLPGDPPRQLAGGDLEGSGAVVDALLGTGFSGEPRGPAGEAIGEINDIGEINELAEHDVPVIACDVPSGVDASTGEVAVDAVAATATATFHGEKIGLRVMPGAFHAGEIEVIEIGIPRGAPVPADRRPHLRPGARPVSAALASRVEVRLRCRDDRRRLARPDGRAGPGGPRRPAGRSGLRQVAVPESAQAAAAQKLLEAMPHGLPEEDGAHCLGGMDALEPLAGRAGALVLGPGLGRSEPAQEFARAVAAKFSGALLIDADGLNAFAGRLEDLRARDGADPPHPPRGRARPAARPAVGRGQRAPPRVLPATPPSGAARPSC